MHSERNCSKELPAALMQLKYLHNAYWRTFAKTVVTGKQLYLWRMNAHRFQWDTRGSCFSYSDTLNNPNIRCPVILVAKLCDHLNQSVALETLHVKCTSKLRYASAITPELYSLHEEDWNMMQLLLQYFS